MSHALAKRENKGRRRSVVKSKGGWAIKRGRGGRFSRKGKWLGTAFNPGAGASVKAVAAHVLPLGAGFVLNELIAPHEAGYLPAAVQGRPAVLITGLLNAVLAKMFLGKYGNAVAGGIVIDTLYNLALPGFHKVQAQLNASMPSQASAVVTIPLPAALPAPKISGFGNSQTDWFPAEGGDSGADEGMALSGAGEYASAMGYIGDDDQTV